jgi:NifU-like protein involved in Fe-S cluster formation
LTADPYSSRVRELFADPHHAGCLDGGTSARVEDQGVSICLCARAEAGKLQALRFRAWACPHVIAACEAFCEAFEGRGVAELLEFDADGLMQSLSVPVEKTGRILVLEDAVRALGTSLCDSAKQN